jgi:hypothetical protein
MIMSNCNQAAVACHRLILAAGPDLNTTATKVEAYVGLFFITVITLLMGWRMLKHYGKGEYPQLGVALFIGLGVIWFIGHVTNAGAVFGTTASSLLTG